MRANFREYLKQDDFKPKYAISLDEERELALTRLQKVCNEDFMSVRDFADNPHRIFAAHELMDMDFSLYKATWNLPECILGLTVRL